MNNSFVPLQAFKNCKALRSLLCQTMINKFFHEYGQQKAAWIHEAEITKESSKDLKVAANDGDILRNRILRTFLKRDAKTKQMTSYNFDPDTFKKYLMIYDAVLPSVITQNDQGHFVLLFETENQLNAFFEGTDIHPLILLSRYYPKYFFFSLFQWNRD